MIMNNKIKYYGLILITLVYASCKIPAIVEKKENKNVPTNFVSSQDTTNSGQKKWKDFFNDPYLAALIDTALNNNQELNIVLQELTIAQNEIKARKGEYLPFVDIAGGAGVDKVGRYTNIGSSEATTEIEPGRETPEPLQNYVLGAFASWEVDIWHKLRNAKKSATIKYFSSIEGKNYLVTNLVAEIANSYYELLALDNQLEIIKNNIKIQSDALEVVKNEKQAARVTELAVKRFEALVLHTKSLQFDIQQQITETENRINFLLGRFPQPIPRSTDGITNISLDSVYAGLPNQLLENRPDIRQAELDLEASKLDVKVAKANFYPALRLTAGVGLEAFNPTYLIKSPESLLYSLVGDMVGPLINRNAIKATYANANAKQIQAAFNYEKTILNGYIEVVNQLSMINNLAKSYELQKQQVEALNQSVTISNGLFRSARADYMEVLMTQRDALESKFELIETRVRQMHAMVNVYRALGGGWK